MKKTWKWKLAQSSEIKWWKRYLKEKSVTEYVEWKKNYWRGLLDRIKDEVHLTEGFNVLDAGCGPAGIFITSDKCHTDAVDPLLDEYDLHLKHFKKSFYPNVRFFSSSIEDFLPDKKYDLIFCMNAINHVSNIHQVIDLLVEWAKPNGKLVITIDVHNFSFFKYLFRIAPGDILHPHQYDTAEYETMFISRNCRLLRRMFLKREFIFSHVILVLEKHLG